MEFRFDDCFYYETSDFQLDDDASLSFAIEEILSIKQLGGDRMLVC